MNPKERISSKKQRFTFGTQPEKKQKVTGVAKTSHYLDIISSRAKVFYPAAGAHVRA
jgi:hypothetical protein